MIAPSVMNLTALAAFSDNHIAMIDDGHAAIVEPATTGTTGAALDSQRIEQPGILTHHQDDHVDGVHHGDVDVHVRTPRSWTWDDVFR